MTSGRVRLVLVGDQIDMEHKSYYVMTYVYMNDNFDGAPFRDTKENEYDDFELLCEARKLLVTNRLCSTYIPGSVRCFLRADTPIDDKFLKE